MAEASPNTIWQLEPERTVWAIQSAPQFAETIHKSLLARQGRFGPVGAAIPCSAEACPIVERMGRAAGIAAIGPLQGQILIGSGQRVEGLAALRKARAVNRALGNVDAADAVGALVAQIEEGDG